MNLDLKLILLGSKNVGKTSLFNRYVYDDFGPTSMTIGAYFGMKIVKSGNTTCSLAIWDTAGEEKFDSLTNFYCRNAAAALVCYDITNYESFAALQRWVDKVNSEAEKNAAMIIVGNKLDLVEENPSARKVDLSEARRYAATVHANVLEVSAKSGANIQTVFEQIVKMCCERHIQRLSTSSSNSEQRSKPSLQGSPLLTRKGSGRISLDGKRNGSESPRNSATNAAAERGASSRTTTQQQRVNLKNEKTEESSSKCC